jgi:hypothetical protein
MPQLIDFQDAVTAANLDPKQTHAVFYVDGRFANHSAVASRCPHAKLYGITVTGITGQGVFAVDSETGDLDVPSTIRWVEKQVALGVKLIVVYANLDRWLNLGLKAALDKYGHRIRRWVADYNDVRAIQPWADAEQYATGNVDRNVALATFFGDAQPAPPPVHQWSAELQVSVPHGSTGKVRVITTVDLGTGQWTSRGLPGVAHFSGPGGGKWRVKGIPLDSKPLGA